MSDTSKPSKYNINAEVVQITEENKGTIIGKNIHQQNLPKAAAEIQQLLKQLQQNHPNAYTNQFTQELHRNQRIRQSLISGGIELIKILCPPLGIPIEIGKTWLDTAQKIEQKPNPSTPKFAPPRP